jgi:hypothetical protein
MYERQGYTDPYFVNETESYLIEDEHWEATPELYFGAGDLMLAAGGQWQRYYDYDSLGFFRDYHVIARDTC